MDLLALEKKYKDNYAQEEVENIEAKLSSRETSHSDMSSLSTDHSYFTELSSYISELQKSFSDLKDAKEMVETEAEGEIKEMAVEEIASLEEKIGELDAKIKKLKISREFQDENDNRSAIIEIRAGAGGDEASLFAADLFRMYSGYASKKGWEIQIIESSLSDSGGYKEVVAQINGKNVFKDLKYESGVHRVQRVPTTESSGRIHTSTASVAILPEAKEVDIQINPEDIKIDVMRASGAGGQCVNKTDSAVRITHLPSGIVVSCQETKYQAQNKEKAMAILRARLYDKKQEELSSKRASMRSKLIGSAMRAEKIRTYNFPQNRITDHRVKKSWFNIEVVLSGDLDEIVHDVREVIMEEILKEAEESGQL